MHFTKLLSTLLVTVSLSFTGLVHATPTFETTDLIDAPGDPDRMQITYRSTDAFEAGGGFSLLFDATRFADLLVTSTAPGWFDSTTQPDALASLDGIVSLMALMDVSGTENVFDIEFTYLGATAPGSQPYEFFNAAFAVTRSGQTLPHGVVQIPEPPMALMLGMGLLLLARQRARLRRRNR